MSKRETGFLVLIGGAEDQKKDKKILRRTVDLNNARNIAVIPTASSYTYEVGQKYIDTFRSLGVKTVNNLEIRYKDQANRKEYLDKISEADLIFFTGGDQVKLVETLKHSELLIRIWQRFFCGATIAGTSAGAAAASNPMIAGGDKIGMVKPNFEYSEGFGFIKGITIDTHFNERCRIPRLAQLISGGISKKAIGLDEDTGIIVSSDNTFSVIGSGTVTVMNGQKMVSKFDSTSDKRQVTVDGLTIGFLSENTRFDIKKWKMTEIGEATKGGIKENIRQLKLSVDKYLNML